jgi:hypothetical protein
MAQNVSTAIPDEQPQGRTVGPKEGFGAGIIALGVFAMLLPAFSDSITKAVKGSTSYAILSGSVLVLGIFIIAVGIALIVAKLDDA